MPRFNIRVTRVGYATRRIEVEAADPRQAEQIALDTAGRYEFREHHAEYQLTHGTGLSARSQHDSIRNQKGGALCPDQI